MSFELELVDAEFKAIQWLVRSYEVSNQTGFSHSRTNYLPSFLAWRKAYPETSGYIIENFLKYNINENLNTDYIAIKVANWLVKIQNVDGSYNSGIDSKKKSFFNTAQILFGLNDAFNNTQNKIYELALNKSIDWLHSCLDSNGNCTKGLYVDHYFAAYYSRALWPVFQILGNETPIKFLRAYDLLWNHNYNSDSFNNMGFYPNKNALTHTIAYTLEGFFEAAKVLAHNDVIVHCLKMSEKISQIILKDESLTAEYSAHWISSAKYKCVTGQAQFVSILCKSYLYERKEAYLSASIILMKELIQMQINDRSINHNGAFPASIPKYGSYFPYQYVNWTNKFFLDACYYLRKCLET